METAYFHVAINHFPVIGVPIILLLWLIAVWRGSDELKAASMLLLVVVGVTGIATWLTGEGSEDFAKTIAGVDREAIEEHQTWATVSLVEVVIATLLAAYGLFRYGGLRLLARRDGNDSPRDSNSKFPGWLTTAMLVLLLIGSGLLFYTSKLGGEVRHTEFSAGKAPAGEKK